MTVETRDRIDGTPCLIGPRHPRANQAFKGSLMIAREDIWRRLDEDTDWTFDDASAAGGFCVTFDEDEKRRMILLAEETFA